MPFGSLGTVWAEFGLDIRKLDQGLMAANLKLAGADKTITSWGQKLTNQSTKLITVGGLMAAAVAGVGIATVKMAADFEKSMRNVNSISKLSEQQFKKQADEVLSLSTRLPQSAKVLADGLYDIASSGFQGAEGMKVLEASAKAASAGLTTTANSAKGITAVLNAYALSADEAGKVSDTMFKTVDKGVITFEELSNTVGDFVGMGKIANLSFDELSGALAYMTTKGVNASEAGVALNRVILSIIDPSAEMATALKNAGYESGEAALQELGLVGVMDLLSGSTGGSLTELQKLFPEMRALKGASALLSSGIDDLTGYMGEFKDTTGATNVALKEQSKSLDFQMQILKNNASAVAIAIGSELIPSITKYTTKLSDYISKNKEVIADNILLTLKIGGISAAFLILIGVLGKLRAVWLTHPIGAIITAYALLNTVISAGASKLEGYGTTAGNVGGELLRLLLPINAAISGVKKSISVWQAYRDGIISWEEAAKASNIFTRGEMLKTIEERRAKEEELASGIYDSLEAFKSAQIYIKNYSDELPNATNEMAYLIQQLQNGELSTEAFTLAIEELRNATGNGRKDIELSTTTYNQFADIQELAKIKVEAHSKAQKEAQGIIDDTTGGIDEQAKSVDELRQEFNDLINEIFGITNAENDLQEVDWEIAAAEKELAEAIRLHGENSEEAGRIENNLDDLYQQKLLTLQALYNEEGLSIERKEELRQKLIELLKQTEETSNLSQEKFVEMATQFGLSGEEIIKMAGEMGFELSKELKETINPAIDTTQEKLDILGKTEATPKITVDNSQALRSIQDVINKMNSIVGKAALIGASGFNTGGIVGYAGGGIIGSQSIPTASSGMVVPQTGRSYLIKAEQDETILNSSQQRNLAEWIMGKANSRPGSGGKIIENLNIYSPEPLTPSEVARQTKNTLRLAGLEAALQ